MFSTCVRTIVLLVVVVMFTPNFATADEKGTKPPEEKPTKKPSVIPIPKVFDVEEVAATLKKCFPAKTVIVPLPDEHALLVYVTEEDLKVIQQLIRACGEKVSKPAPKTFTFRFKNAKWDDVLDWYAKTTGLTLITTVKPMKGTFTFDPPAGKKFTLQEITDILNDGLAQEMFILIPRTMTFFLHPADEKLDGSGISRVPLADLAKRGRTELVEVLVTLKEIDADHAAGELRKLLTPFGEIVVAEQKYLLVRDTVGNIRRMLTVLDAIDKPIKSDKPTKSDPVLRTISLTKLKVADLQRQLLYEFPQIQFVVLTGQNQVMVLATLDVQNRVLKFVRNLENPPQKAPPTPKADPEPKTYSLEFKRTPWEDVLDWYAKTSGLKADVMAKPKGPVTAHPGKDRKFTLAEITDILNESLAQQKLLLVPTQRSFAVVSTEKKIDPKYIPAIELADLRKMPRTGIVEVALPIKDLDVEDIADEVKKMLTPWGEIVYAKGKWLILRDTVGNIERIRSALQSCAKAEVPALKK